MGRARAVRGTGSRAGPLPFGVGRAFCRTETHVGRVSPCAQTFSPSAPPGWASFRGPLRCLARLSSSAAFPGALSRRVPKAPSLSPAPPLTAARLVLSLSRQAAAAAAFSSSSSCSAGRGAGAAGGLRLEAVMENLQRAQAARLEEKLRRAQAAQPGAGGPGGGGGGAPRGQQPSPPPLRSALETRAPPQQQPRPCGGGAAAAGSPLALRHFAAAGRCGGLPAPSARAPPLPPPLPLPTRPPPDAAARSRSQTERGSALRHEEEEGGEEEEGEAVAAEPHFSQRPSSGPAAASPPPAAPQQQHHEWTYEEQFKQLYELDTDPKRKEFLDDLFGFMQKRGTPVNRIPIMAKQVLDLYTLYRLVTEKGGLVEVINKKIWREITKGLNLPTSITSAAFTLRTQYMKYLYPYECEKRGLSSPGELQAAIDSNRREGRRQTFGTTLFNYSPVGTPAVLSSSKIPLPALTISTHSCSQISQMHAIKKEESILSSAVPSRIAIPVSLTGHPLVAAQATASQAAALEQLREKLETGEPPEKKMALVAEEQQRLVQHALQQNLLAMASQFPVNIKINNRGDDRQEAALNLSTNGISSINMSIEINGVVYTGVLFARRSSIPGSAAGAHSHVGPVTSQSQLLPATPRGHAPASASP
ncbi:AT-rich interactive domain-containing protein 3C [Hemicordylus capensis]|uniref:AT-rich interactive domain-containing protein 3C n=1 Tax=Hemicordylus capensis TaxID=884348 RepID=UPI002302AD59|nr:AT-rich interactive domain-containing protein 3C [Hemicordylus capensis]